MVDYHVTLLLTLTPILQLIILDSTWRTSSVNFHQITCCNVINLDWFSLYTWLDGVSKLPAPLTGSIGVCGHWYWALHRHMPGLYQRGTKLVSAHGPPCSPRLFWEQYFPGIFDDHWHVVSYERARRPLALLAVIGRFLFYNLQPHPLCHCKACRITWWNCSLALYFLISWITDLMWSHYLLFYTGVSPWGSLVERRREAYGVRFPLNSCGWSLLLTSHSTARTMSNQLGEDTTGKKWSWPQVVEAFQDPQLYFSFINSFLANIPNVYVALLRCVQEIFCNRCWLDSVESPHSVLSCMRHLALMIGSPCYMGVLEMVLHPVN